MKTTVKKIVVVAISILGMTTLNAQDNEKHEFRAFYGTAYAASDSDIFAETLSNGLLGIAQKTETTTWGMVGLGYRYHISRVSLGIELGLSTADEKLFKKEKDAKPFETKKIKRFFALPTAAYSYYKSNLIELYGGASLGIIKEHVKSENKNTKEESKTSLGYQITPIGMRLGNTTIGGFIELGYGQKGLVNAGLSFKF